MLEFLGTGSAFTTDPDNFQSNLLLVGATGERLMIDCGTDARRALHTRGLGARDIAAVYVSHLHSDHVGGLEWLGFTTHFDPAAARVKLFAAAPIIEPLWRHVLSGGMRVITDGDAELATYFDIVALPERARFDWDGVELELVPTPHVLGSKATITSYGLFLRGPSRTAFITTDTVYTWHDAFEAADVVLHDCEISDAPTGVHPPYRTLREALPAHVREKTWLYGYGPGARPDARADGFAGFAEPAQRFGL